MYNGLINVYKEPGFTSMDVIAVLRGILGQKKIGHTGTLDPAAEGVLLVCLGNATKLCDMLENHDKTYRCSMILGRTTDTEDTTGTVTGEYPVNVDDVSVTEAIKSFIGDYDQIPPMYSAIKVNGKKLYDIARSGGEVERKPRHIRIFDITDIVTDLPRVSFTVSCSKGTYIRSLCRDIGDKLSCGGCMEKLIRIKAGDFDISTSLKLDEIKKLAVSGDINESVIPTEKVFEKSPVLKVKHEYAKLIDNGNPLMTECVEPAIIPDKGQRFRVYNTNNVFVATYIFDTEKNRLMPEKMFLQ